MPSSRPVRGEPALGGGVEGGAWESQDSGQGMALDSVTDMAGAGDSARSGQVRLGEGADHGVLLQGVGDDDVGLGDTLAAAEVGLPDDGLGPAGRPAGFSSCN